jgi:cytochrome c
MNNLEFNKIFAALLIAGIIAMLCGFIAKKIIHPKPLDQMAVMIDVAEAAETGPAVAAGPEPILALLATADIEKGKNVAKACTACHNLDKGGKDGVGPHLWGIVGRGKDSVAGFAYSGELEKVGDKTWTYAELNHFLYKPKAYAAGTKMNYLGIKKPTDRAALIAYLRTLSDTPAALPSADAITAETPPAE